MVWRNDKRNLYPHSGRPIRKHNQETMIKKTLYFGNPAYLSLRNAQLVIKLPEVENNDWKTTIRFRKR